MNSLVTEYRIAPGSQTTVGVDLGKPIRTYKPESLVQKGCKDIVIISETRVKSIAKSAANGNDLRLHGKNIWKLRISGVSREELAERNGISISTLRNRLNEWNVAKVDQEKAAMEALKNG